MKVSVGKEEQYPSLYVGSRFGEATVDLPSPLIAKLERARKAETEAERRILEHLKETGQLPPGWEPWLEELTE